MSDRKSLLNLLKPYSRRFGFLDRDEVHFCCDHFCPRFSSSSLLEWILIRALSCGGGKSQIQSNSAKFSTEHGKSSWHGSVLSPGRTETEAANVSEFPGLWQLSALKLNISAEFVDVNKAFSNLLCVKIIFFWSEIWSSFCFFAFLDCKLVKQRFLLIINHWFDHFQTQMNLKQSVIFFTKEQKTDKHVFVFRLLFFCLKSFIFSKVSSNL